MISITCTGGRLPKSFREGFDSTNTLRLVCSLDIDIERQESRSGLNVDVLLSLGFVNLQRYQSGTTS